MTHASTSLSSRHTRFQRLITRWRKGVRILLFTAIVLILGTIAALYSYGKFAEGALGKPSYALPALADDTRLDRDISQRLASRDNPNESGLLLIDDNIESYAIRARSAREAKRSIDVMYYIWKADQSGRLLMDELMSAANRGVRVRLLLDDLNQRGMDEVLLSLNSHENVEVRLFNPTRNREGSIGRAIEMIFRAASVNRRLHNKAWIVDNRISIVGGRNVGDEYFDGADRMNFTDADLLMIGPAVEASSAIFDQFWNSRAVIPIQALNPNLLSKFIGPKAEFDDSIERQRSYRHALETAVSSTETWISKHRIYWADNVRVLSDPPEKAFAYERGGADRKNLLIDSLSALFQTTQDELVIISPYFVPGVAGTNWLSEKAKDKSIRILTNSLAATDVILVHSGYYKYRHQLLKSGIEILELIPDQKQKLAWLGSSSASLHTKAIVIDKKAGFVGSFNFDPRSTWLNTEMGVFFEQPELAMALRDMYESKREPGRSHALYLEDDQIRWRDSRTNPDTIWTTDPDSHWWVRSTVFILGLLPIESQL